MHCKYLFHTNLEKQTNIPYHLFLFDMVTIIYNFVFYAFIIFLSFFIYLTHKIEKYPYLPTLIFLAMLTETYNFFFYLIISQQYHISFISHQ